MAQLEQILISSLTPKWHERLREIHAIIRQATYFDEGDNNDTELNTILKGVKTRGNAALAEYTEKFDDVKLTPEQFRVTADELKKAHTEIDKKLLTSIRRSIANVKKYQNEIFTGRSIPGKINYTPIKRVGICVPGASAPLPSTVIMTAVPAQVAGVKDIVVISPPRYKGGIHPVILAVCYELKITEVYRIGGAHAVAALAFGTNTIEPVNKIVGPGNRWVQMAKRKVFGFVDIDSIAGPSEVLIIADDSANPAWVAADMLSQAEHDPGTAVVFTDSQKLAEKVVKELEKQIPQLNRFEQTEQCLKKFSNIIVFANMEEVITQANYFAPEHLEIQCGDRSGEIAERIENAGAIFIGDYSPVAVGDYWAGPSHTLPTGQTAKFFSALSANDFVKSMSIIEYSAEQLAASANDIIRLAMVEGLDAHAKSIRIRRDNC
jgi:histidinol dehydrogenase